MDFKESCDFVWTMNMEQVECLIIQTFLQMFCFEWTCEGGAEYIRRIKPSLSGRWELSKVRVKKLGGES